MRPSACLLFLLFCAALPAQELIVREGSPTGTAITDNEPVGGLRDYGFVLAGMQSYGLALYFTNNRATNINFGYWLKTGANPNEFFVDSSLFSYVLAPGQTTTLIVTFYRTTLGIGTATISVQHDAAGSGVAPFEINLRAEVVAPALQVTVGTPSGPDVSHNQSAVGTARDFGGRDVNLGPSAPITIFLTNTGTGMLNVSKPDMGGVWWNQYQVSASFGGFQLGAGQSASFTVTFDPTNTGLKDAYVRIAHTYTLLPSPFFVPVLGNGAGTPTPTPVAALQLGAAGIPAGAHHDLGASTAGGVMQPFFQIRNTGTADLHLTGTPMVLVHGEYGCIVTTASGPSSPISPNGSSAFQLSIQPLGHGAYGFSLSIATNSPVSNPYDVTVGGSSVVSPTRLSMVIEPASTPAAQAFVIHPMIAITDNLGYVRSDDSSTVVAVSITPGTGAPGAVLSGTLSAVASNGVVTFHNLQIDQPGFGYSLTFTAQGGSLLPVTSLAFTVTGPPAPPAPPPAPGTPATDDESCSASPSASPLPAAVLLGAMACLWMRRRARA